MTQADAIRKFACDNYIAAARRRGDKHVTIRAGDVQRDMGLMNVLPAICSALGSNKFMTLASAKQTTRTGPANGSNALFEFDL